jgi:hypothetical protein
MKKQVKRFSDVEDGEVLVFVILMEPRRSPFLSPFIELEPEVDWQETITHVFDESISRYVH